MINWENYNKKQKEIENEFPWFDTCNFEIPEGWLDLAKELCNEIAPILKEQNFFESYCLFQIKEKFGGLRWYSNYRDPQIDEIVRKYEDLSRETCVCCGKKATHVTKEYIQSFCDDCYKLYKEGK